VAVGRTLLGIGGVVIEVFVTVIAVVAVVVFGDHCPPPSTKEANRANPGDNPVGGMVGWGREEESYDNPKPVPPPGPTPGTVGVAALGEGWDEVDDGVPLIDVSSSIIVLNH